MTEEIKHIDEKSQEYIAEGNRMTKEIKIHKKDSAACNFWKACDYYKQLKRLEQENKELKEEIQFHNKENSNLLAERNAAQIGYDEIREVRERYRSALEEIRERVKNPIALSCFASAKFVLEQIEKEINEVLK